MRNAVLANFGKNLRRHTAALLSVVVFTLIFLPGCGSVNSINPLCGSARPVPVIGSLSATTITLAQVQVGFALVVTGSDFVSASIVEINGVALSTTVQSNQQLEVVINSSVISATGTATVTVDTPGGNSSDLGCNSGGTSSALTLTIT
jgi:hypothetical protein